MESVSRSGWNLVIVEWHEYVLDIASVNLLAVPVEDEGVEEMCPAIDTTGRVGQSTPCDALAIELYIDLYPHLVGVGSSVSEHVPHAQCSQDRLQQHRFSRLKQRDGRADRCFQWGIDLFSSAEPKDVDTDGPLEKACLISQRLLAGADEGVQRRVGPWEQVIVKL